MDTKECSHCKSEFPETNEYFSKQSSGKNGLNSCCKKCCTEKSKKYYLKHKEQRSNKMKKYYQKNKNKYLVNQKKWRKANEERYRENQRNYLKRMSSEKKRIIYAQKRHKRTARSAMVEHSLTIKQWKFILLAFEHKCAYCGKSDSLTREHFIPLSLGGNYSIYNIIPTCMMCNCSKSANDFFDWYPQQPFYSKQRVDFILDHFEKLNKQDTLEIAG